MHNIDIIKDKYMSLGVREDNLDFAIDAVSEGTKREIIIESLTAGYRGMSKDQSLHLLDDLYAATGGEFKKENSGGYLYGTLLLLIGLLGSGFLIAMLLSGEGELKFVMLSGTAALFGLTKGGLIFYKTFRGTYRDNDSPFQNS
jgi:hypothetical protein